ncbi:Jun dimerization protein 1, isoform CRA_a [Rattus norvegicus]|uniref:Jun dimerization protein 1, isoform CRA_a n=1 Tax=Rattus norvegicus TaxID=10116 RepID=A6JGY9_RAT|nr:Jun dimerization protein 1, isoform CRA_a [Rattus norvegicus]EDL94994.1 Jun dimerization protein 1, isoform CRA_a [Rattus norvegicus]
MGPVYSDSSQRTGGSQTCRLWRLKRHYFLSSTVRSNLRAPRMMTGRFEEERKTGLQLRGAERSRHRRLTSFTRNMRVWSRRTLCCAGRSRS